MLRRARKAVHWKVLVRAAAEAAGRMKRMLVPPVRATALAVLALASVMLDGRAAVAGLVNSDPELEAALSCGAAKKSNPCEVAACFNHYLANTPPNEVSKDATAMLEGAAQACPQKNVKEDEERLLKVARECMVTAEACVVKTCYKDYLEKYGATGSLRGVAQFDIARAQKACPPQPPSNSEGCGATSQFGIHIAIKGGAISWEHDFKGISYKWVGIIDPTGGIRASVGNSTEFVANGQYTDGGREILMHYPQCGSGTISLSILGRLN
jgi:hypothetical protein